MLPRWLGEIFHRSSGL